jgi:hypothetical protein
MLLEIFQSVRRHRQSIAHNLRKINRLDEIICKETEDQTAETVQSFADSWRNFASHYATEALLPSRCESFSWPSLSKTRADAH